MIRKATSPTPTQPRTVAASGIPDENVETQMIVSTSKL